MALALVHEQAEAGRDLTQLLGDLISHFRNLLLVQADPSGLVGELGHAVVEGLKEQCQGVDRERLLELIDLCAAAEQKMKWASNKQMYLEVAILRAIQAVGQVTLGEVLEALSALREGRPVSERPKPVFASVQAPPPRAKPVVVSPKTVSKEGVKDVAKEASPAQNVAVVREEAPASGAAISAPPLQSPQPPAVAPVPEPAPSERQDGGRVPLSEPRLSEPLVEVAAGASLEPEMPFAEAAPTATKPVGATGALSKSELPRAAVEEVPEPAKAVAGAAVVSDAEPSSSGEAAAVRAVLDVVALWPLLVETVRKERPLISMWLEGGVLSDLSGGVARLVFPKEQPLSAEYLLQANNRTFLEGLLKRLTGSEISLRTELSETVVLRPVAQPPPPPKEVVKDPMEEFKNDPLIRKALEIFKARLEAV